MLLPEKSLGISWFVLEQLGADRGHRRIYFLGLISMQGLKMNIQKKKRKKEKVLSDSRLPSHVKNSCLAWSASEDEHAIAAVGGRWSRYDAFSVWGYHLE